MQVLCQIYMFCEYSVPMYSLPLSINSTLQRVGFCLFFKRFDLFERERTQPGGWQAEGEGGADSPQSRDLMRSLIPGPWDHDLSQRQTLNQLSHPDAPWETLHYRTQTEGWWRGRCINWLWALTRHLIWWALGLICNWWITEFNIWNSWCTVCWLIDLK